MKDGIMPFIVPHLFTDEERPRLIGGKSRSTDRIVFPCPTGEDYAPYPLVREGRVWSYTIQRYRPKSPPYRGPEDFAPWPVAYVELPGEVIVEARLTDVAFDDIKIGMDVELMPIPLDPDNPHADLIPAFRPKRTLS